MPRPARGCAVTVKTLRVIIGLSFLVLLISWLSVRAINSDAERFDHVLSEANTFSMADAQLHHDVLAARAGMLRNYDPLVRGINELYGGVGRLRSMMPTNERSTAALDQLEQSVKSQERLIEKFKSDNALLQNSLAYFALFSSRLSKPVGNAPLAQEVSALAVAMLHLALDTRSASADEVKNRLDALAQKLVPPEDGEAVQALLAHGHLLHELLPAVDGLLKSLSTASEQRDRDSFLTIVLAEQASSRATSRLFRFFLYVTSLLLTGLLVVLALQLRAWALALRRRAALEHVIAEVSMRFMNSQPQDIGAHIGRAIAEIAQCVGADRGYFIPFGSYAGPTLWCRPGIGFSSGWQDRIKSLIASANMPPERLVQIPSARRLRAGKDKEACLALGVQGWACAISSNVNKIDAILGFDTVNGPSRITRPGELNLLPMALDAIVNAARRQCVEQERARLEVRLHRARRMETVGGFASGIAHNFNNIVGAILGYAEMAEARGGSDKSVARNLEGIRRAGERARNLVDQILAFGRHRDTRRMSVNVSMLIAEATSLLTASLPPTVDLVICQSSRSVVVSVEPTQLQQVIFNLCVNASQAMDGSGRIEIDVQRIEISRSRAFSHGELGPGRYACISVSDSGRGMDEVTLERIFELFFTTRVDGNGLGLATTREVVREYGGAIHVESVPGAGSRFEIWLPCVVAEETVAADEVSVSPLGHGETVLIVDDNREQLLRTEEILAALGYEPVGFMTAEEALASCRREPNRFDAFIIGHLMSGQAMLELAAQLRKTVADAPILLAKASVQEDSARTLVVAGVSEVVSRPIIVSEITTALARCFAMTAEQNY
jgi:signal transduction histidine kinase/ActR/RegA family two-component response regulator